MLDFFPSPKFHESVTESPSGSVTAGVNATDSPASGSVGVKPKSAAGLPLTMIVFDDDLIRRSPLVSRAAMRTVTGPGLA